MPTDVPAEDLPDNLSNEVPESDLPDNLHPSHLSAASQAAAQEKYSPTEGQSTFDTAMAGAGKAVMDPWRGIRQLFGDKSAQSEIDEAKKLDKPLMNTTAGQLGYLGGTAAEWAAGGGLAAEGAGALGLGRTASVLGGIANPASIGAAAGSGAVQGLTAPVATGESRLWNTTSGAAGGVAGNLLARGGSALLSAAHNVVGESASKAAQALMDAGVPLDAAQRTGSTLLNRAKAMLSDNPLTESAQRYFAERQQTAVNRAFLSTMGERADAATPEVMGRAMQRLSNTYEDVANRVNVNYDHIQTPLEGLLDDARLSLNDSQFSTIQRNVDDILDKAAKGNGVINGRQYQNIKQTLDRLSAGGDRDVGAFGRDLRGIMQDGLLQSAQASGNVADANLLKQTNQQWRNMRTIENGISNNTRGDISPAAISNTLSTKANRSVSIYGKGDTALSNLADAANELLPSKYPNSGTLSRIMNQAALPVAMGTVEGIRTGDLKKAGLAAGAGYLLPKAVQSLLNAQNPGVQGFMGWAARAAGPQAFPALAGGIDQHLPASALQTAQAGMGADTGEPSQ